MGRTPLITRTLPDFSSPLLTTLLASVGTVQEEKDSNYLVCNMFLLLDET